MKSGTLGETTASHLDSITDQIEDGIKHGRYTWTEVQGKLTKKTKAAAEATDAYVHENPWRIVGMAAGLGLIIGLIMARSRND